MFHAPKNNWQPSATIACLKQRAAMVNAIRHFFHERGVLEVDTPLLSHASVTDPHVIGIPALFKHVGRETRTTLYLQTSPEYAMKRLLAAHAGPIFQLCKAFRQGDLSRLHNPEFTILEWYRPAFDHHQLMDEMDALLQILLGVGVASRVTYAEMFEARLGINPHSATAQELALVAKQQGIELVGDLGDDQTGWLDLLLTHCIEPHLGQERPLFVYDFPSKQAALAKIRPGNPPVASRFEVYFKGVELANGFHELQDADEQRRRFLQELVWREEQGLPTVPIDENFLAALSHGFPDCSGVALGFDRLMMLATDAKTIGDVMSFQFQRA